MIRPRVKLAILISLALASGLIMYSLTSSPLAKSSQRPGSTVSIEAVSSNPYSGKSYSPFQVSVILGVNSTVSWVNDDSVAHTVTAEDGLFDSGIMNPGERWTHLFSKTGSYSYRCTPHPWMTGIIKVHESSDTSKP